MKWLVKDNDYGTVIDEFNTKKEAERYIKHCKEKDAENGFCTEYTILLRSIR